MRTHNRTCTLVVAATLAALTLAHPAGQPAEQPALRAVAPKSLLIGAAVNQRQSDGQDPAAHAIVERHFNTITAENLLKWEAVHPASGRFNFDPADRFVSFGQQHGLAVIGHVLVWHQQTPKWVFEGPDGKRVDRDTLLARMREHIQAVAGRYKGRIHGWDVVNEALDEDGSLRKTPWLEIIGPDFIDKAFEYAREADPGAELYYNEYNLWKPAKRAAAIKLVRDLRAKGLRVDAIGEQAHWGLETPTLPEMETMFADLAGSGAKTVITELDIDVLPRDPDMWGADLDKKSQIKARTNIYPDGLPPAKQQQLARHYGDIFRLVMKHQPNVARVTFWGVTDAQSWLHNFPIPGRTNYPLLWDRHGQPKPAFDAVVAALRGK